MRPWRRTGAVRTDSRAIELKIWFVIEMADRGGQHTALEALRPRVWASRPPSISDAAQSPVEPISVLCARDVVTARLSAKSRVRVNPRWHAPLRKTPASMTHQLHPAEELGFDKYHFDRQHHHRQYAVE